MSSILRVAHTLTWDPKVIAGGTYVSKNKTYYFHGGGVPVVTDIAEMLNLTVEITFGEYHEAYDIVANGSADMGGLIISQEYAWIHRGFETVLVYLHPLDGETSDVYFRQPSADAQKNTITRPFSINLWMALLFLMLVISLISRRNFTKSIFYTFWITIVHALELLIGRHDVHFCLAEFPTGIALARLIISFFGIIITSVYVAQTASFLVLKEDLVKTPDDLIKYKYKLNTYSALHVNKVFENSIQKNVTASVVNFADEEQSFISNVIGKPRDDPRVTLFSHPDGFYANALFTLNYNTELCSVSVLKSIQKTPRSFFISKASPLREAINLSIVKLLERGLNYRHQVKFKKRYQYSCDQPETEFNELTLRFVEVGFVPLLVGSILAVTLDGLQYLLLRTRRIRLNSLNVGANPQLEFLF